MSEWSTREAGRRLQSVTDIPMPIGTAVIGYGYWGPNLARNLSERPEFNFQVLCDLDAEQRAAVVRRFPHVRTTARFVEVLEDPVIDAVIIATPPQSHYALAKAALSVGKHVLVEKPLATRLSDACELAALASTMDLVLMPGHTFIYSPAVNTVRDLIRVGDIGDIHFITSSRMNLGKYQRDGVICDLAPHDLSILLYWLNRPILEVSATARSVFRYEVPETAFMTLGFMGGTTANVQLSWLAPRKVRQMIVVGSKLMVQYDDTATDEPVRIYDRGMDVSVPANFGEHQLTYRSGDIISPRVAAIEPLSAELQDFANAINTGEEPRSSVALGVSIVAALEGAVASMRARGAPQPVSPLPLVGGIA
jgi:predicted dehydrogenase